MTLLHFSLFLRRYLYSDLLKEGKIKHAAACGYNLSMYEMLLPVRHWFEPLIKNKCGIGFWNRRSVIDYAIFSFMTSIKKE